MSLATPGWLPLLIPIVVLDLGIVVFALVDLVRRERVRAIPKWAWALIICGISFFGALAYLLVGRED